MKMTAINVYQVDLPLKEGRYSRFNANFVEVFDSTVVETVIDEGLSLPSVRWTRPACPATRGACARGWRNWRRISLEPIRSILDGTTASWIPCCASISSLKAAII